MKNAGDQNGSGPILQGMKNKKTRREGSGGHLENSDKTRIIS